MRIDLLPEPSDTDSRDTLEAPYESLKEYYSRSSYGQLQIDGTVFDWYQTGLPRPAASTNPNSTDRRTEDRLTREALIKEAVDFLDGEGHDFTQYDNNNDGKIDYFIVIWTGPKEGDLWDAYNVTFQDMTYTVDGKELRWYSWLWESPGATYFHPRVAIHEAGHGLGLPDLYDTNPPVGPPGGVGGLDIMGSPAKGDHNCFSKWLLGWIDPTVVESDTSGVALDASGTSGDAVAIMPDFFASSTDPAIAIFSEFFMAQNRHRVGNDDTPNMPTNGMLIWHVDATPIGTPPDILTFLYDNSFSDHKLIRLVQADGLDEIEDSGLDADAGDYYGAGTPSDNTSFTPSTNPDSDDYGGTPTDVHITDISAPGETMTAVFSIGPPSATTSSSSTSSTTTSSSSTPSSVSSTSSSVSSSTSPSTIMFTTSILIPTTAPTTSTVSSTTSSSTSSSSSTTSTSSTTTTSITCALQIDPPIVKAFRFFPRLVVIRMSGDDAEFVRRATTVRFDTDDIRILGGGAFVTDPQRLFAVVIVERQATPGTYDVTVVTDGEECVLEAGMTIE
jgi:M6 family metalloprotease-like protein